jgi:hypothetical protein
MISKEELKLYNPRLYWDGVGRGEISYSESGGLVWGSAASPPFIEGILGGPHSPEYYLLDPDAVPPTGESGQYPKPWRSAAQKLQNANYTYVGPYAKFVGFKKCTGSGCITNTCTEANENSKVKPSAVWGRYGVALSGPNSGQTAFFPQDWYNPSEGTYDAEYWNTQYSPEPLWQTRKKWWGSISRKTITTRFGNTGLLCEIEVAYNTPQFGTDAYFAGVDASIYNDYSLDLLVIMVGIAALTRWL